MATLPPAHILAPLVAQVERDGFKLALTPMDDGRYAAEVRGGPRVGLHAHADPATAVTTALAAARAGRTG